MFLKPIESKELADEENPWVSKAEKRRQLMHAKIINTDHICKTHQEHDPLANDYNCQFDQ
jgi:hypothetical protein